MPPAPVRPTHVPPRQRGTVLVIALVALTVMLLGAVALVRGMDASLLMAGNLAFKRDLLNQAERGAQAALKQLVSGGLASDAQRQNNDLTRNYSASQLATNSQGLPLALIDDTAYGTAGFTAADITDSTTGVTVRYLIERLCATSGDFTAVNCVTAAGSADSAGDDRYRKVNPEQRPLYRISVRAIGPRRTQTYIQTTVTL